MVVDLPRCGPMLSPRVPNLVPIPGPRMERETPGQRPRPNCGHPHDNEIDHRQPVEGDKGITFEPTEMSTHVEFDYLFS